MKARSKSKTVQAEETPIQFPFIEVTDEQTGRKIVINIAHIVAIETRGGCMIEQKLYLWGLIRRFSKKVVPLACHVWTAATIWNAQYKAPLSVCWRVTESEARVLSMIAFRRVEKGE